MYTLFFSRFVCEKTILRIFRLRINILAYNTMKITSAAHYQVTMKATFFLNNIGKSTLSIQVTTTTSQSATRLKTTNFNHQLIQQHQKTVTSLYSPKIFQNSNILLEKTFNNYTSTQKKISTFLTSFVVGLNSFMIILSLF